MPATVADVMSREPIAVTPETSMKEAIQLLAENRISGMPVLDAQQKLVGVISETDLLWQESGVDVPPYIAILDSVIYLKNPVTFEQELHKAVGATVADAMTTKVKTTTPEITLREASRKLHGDGVHRLPVLDEAGKVVGILTRGDIIRAMAAGLS
ncbi:MAG: CBS domain-containing protein [Cyanobacteria bacterium P01_D01_bin.73]